MRYNKKIQRLADECARENHYFCASYLGRKGETFIFALRHTTSERLLEGLPHLVIVEDGKASFRDAVEDFRYLDGLRKRDYKKGRALYRELERKVRDNDFANDEEENWMSEIVHNQWPGYDVPIDKETLYDYLEIADRFGLTLSLEPCEWTMERNDGWEYYLRLKSSTMEEMKVSAGYEYLGEIRDLYESAFPEEEQLPWSDLLRLTDAMPLDFTAYYDVDTFVGLTIVLPRSNYNWFWYFAVDERLRGKGYGQKILTHIIEQYQGKRLILDMESPRQECDNLDQRLRRRDFYLRNGFKDTEAEKTFEGITYTILMKGDGTFTTEDYDNIIAELRKFWEVPTEEKV